MPRDDGSRAAGRKLASVINLPLCAAAHALTPRVPSKGVHGEEWNRVRHELAVDAD